MIIYKLMSGYMTLEVIETNVSDRISTRPIVAQCPVNRNVMLNDSLYESLERFMNDKRFIRLGSAEQVATWRLANLFNEITKNNVSFNSKFPELMKKYMEEHKQYNITKKVRKNGTMYIGIGLASDDMPKERKPYTSLQETKAEKEKREETKILRRGETLRQIKDEIMRRTGWNELNYMRLIDLAFIRIYHNGISYDINTMIKVAEGNILRYVYENIEQLRDHVRHAEHVRKDFEKATEHDIYQTTQQNFPIFTQRIKVATLTYQAGYNLNKAINKYIDHMTNVPNMEDIVYPDTQYLQNLANWLLAHSNHKNQTKMATEQRATEEDIFFDTEETRFERSMDEGTLIIGLMCHS